MPRVCKQRIYALTNADDHFAFCPFKGVELRKVSRHCHYIQIIEHYVRALRCRKRPRLTNLLLVAVWPGMEHTAISAGYYLMSRLGMHGLAKLSSRELLVIDQVEVKLGLSQSGRLSRSRLFVWIAPNC